MSVSDGPLNRKYVTIVTGTFRSGTSLMCALLQAGGIEVVYDEEEHTPDEFNPLGYFEAKNRYKPDCFAKWIPACRGKAVKIFIYFLPFLPYIDKPYRFLEPYRVIAMKRDHAAVMASLHRGRMNPEVYSDPTVYPKKLEQVKARSDMRIIEISFDDLIANPRRNVELVSEFLGGLDVDKMVKLIDPTLKHF